MKKQDRCPNAILPRKQKSDCKQCYGNRQNYDSPCRQIVKFDAIVWVVNHLVGSDACPMATWTAPAGRRCDETTTCRSFQATLRLQPAAMESWSTWLMRRSPKRWNSIPRIVRRVNSDDSKSCYLHQSQIPSRDISQGTLRTHIVAEDSGNL